MLHYVENVIEILKKLFNATNNCVKFLSTVPVKKLLYFILFWLFFLTILAINLYLGNFLKIPMMQIYGDQIHKNQIIMSQIRQIYEKAGKSIYNALKAQNVKCDFTMNLIDWEREDKTLKALNHSIFTYDEEFGLQDVMHKIKDSNKLTSHSVSSSAYNLRTEVFDTNKSFYQTTKDYAQAVGGAVNIMFDKYYFTPYARVGGTAWVNLNSNFRSRVVIMFDKQCNDAIPQEKLIIINDALVSDVDAMLNLF
jgi:hypothetical protein